MSGADLEYQNMLRRAGVESGIGMDGARLEQLGDVNDQGGGGGGSAGIIIYDDILGWPARPSQSPLESYLYSGNAPEPPTDYVDGCDLWVRDQTIEDLPAGSSTTVMFNEDTQTWPPRPTERTDIEVRFKGGSEANQPPSGEEFSGIDVWMRNAE